MNRSVFIRYKRNGSPIVVFSTSINFILSSVVSNTKHKSYSLLTFASSFPSLSPAVLWIMRCKRIRVPLFTMSGFRLLVCDTLCEDNDTVRFLVSLWVRTELLKSPCPSPWSQPSNQLFRSAIFVFRDLNKC